jgi:hypothetical protein
VWGEGVARLRVSVWRGCGWLSILRVSGLGLVGVSVGVGVGVGWWAG